MRRVRVGKLTKRLLAGALARSFEGDVTRRQKGRYTMKRGRIPLVDAESFGTSTTMACCVWVEGGISLLSGELSALRSDRLSKIMRQK